MMSESVWRDCHVLTERPEILPWEPEMLCIMSVLIQNGVDDPVDIGIAVGPDGDGTQFAGELMGAASSARVAKIPRCAGSGA